MSTQASVHSIDALKEFRVAMALFAEEALAALGGVDMEVKRTVLWLQHDRKYYWQEQIKRRRQEVSLAQAEVFRRKLAKTADHAPAYTEQKELLRKAEARLREAEAKAALVRKWEPVLQQAILEYRASTRRISDLAAGDVPRAMVLLGRMIDALEAYLRVAPPSGHAGPSPLEAVADQLLAEPPAAASTPGVEGASAGVAAAKPAAESPPATEPTGPGAADAPA